VWARESERPEDQKTRRGRRTWHVWKLVAWEPGDPTSDQVQQTALVRIARSEATIPISPYRNVGLAC
jgi:hypothetical protein